MNENLKLNEEQLDKYYVIVLTNGDKEITLDHGVVTFKSGYVMVKRDICLFKRLSLCRKLVTSGEIKNSANLENYIFVTFKFYKELYKKLSNKNLTDNFNILPINTFEDWKKL